MLQNDYQFALALRFYQHTLLHRGVLLLLESWERTYEQMGIYVSASFMNVTANNDAAAQCVMKII